MIRFFKVFATNFWVRNGIIATFLAVVQQYISPDKGLAGKLFGISISFTLYCWLVFHNIILIEKRLLKRQYFTYTISLILGISFYVSLMYSTSKNGISWTILPKGIFYGLFNTLIASVVYFAFKYFRDQHAFAQKQLYMYEIEQKYLRNQLSPHFLFNTLNNIYSYSLINSTKTPELILKLSELMRYLIEFSKHDGIALIDEILFIENYIAFEKERLEERCDIVFKKNIENETLILPPLLFFPLIENAFKHGTNTMKDCFVHIQISQNGSSIKVNIKNKIISTNQPSTKSGIENVKKRLDLIYPEYYNLTIKNDQMQYEVLLNLNLDFNVRNNKVPDS